MCSEPGFPKRVHPLAEPLSPEQVAKVHEATLAVLDRVGVGMGSARVRRALAEAGARVEEREGRVRFPPSLVEEAVARAPRKFVLAAREPGWHLPVGGGRSYLCLDGCAPELVDPETGKRRASTAADLGMATRVADALPEIAFVWQAVAARDVPPPVEVAHELAVQFANTGKHVQVMTALTPASARMAVRLATVVAGGPEALRKRPIISAFVCSLSPLCYDEGPIEAALVFGEAGVPCGFVAMPIACATAPATVAGTLVVTNAEVLAGIATLQLIQPGASTFYGACSTVIDLRTGVAACGGPEDVLLQMAAAQMARWYGLPCSIGTFACGAKWPNWQAGVENMLSGAASFLAGADMLCGAGLLYGARVFSYEQLLLDVEICRVLVHLAEGIATTDEDLAVAVIEAVGPGGHFLGHQHTIGHMRRMWMARFFDRHAWEDWDAAGRPDPAGAARERVLRIMRDHRPPPLDRGVQEEMDRLLAGFGGGSLS